MRIEVASAAPRSEVRVRGVFLIDEFGAFTITQGLLGMLADLSYRRSVAGFV